MEMVTITIDGQQVQVPKTATILEAAHSIGVNIPSLCYHPELRPEGACRVCMVEVEGARTLVASCVYPVARVHFRSYGDMGIYPYRLVSGGHRRHRILYSA